LSIYLDVALGVTLFRVTSLPIWRFGPDMPFVRHGLCVRQRSAAQIQFSKKTAGEDCSPDRTGVESGPGHERGEAAEQPYGRWYRRAGFSGLRVIPGKRLTKAGPTGREILAQG
jgi:hypothetical protein